MSKKSDQKLQRRLTIYTGSGRVLIRDDEAALTRLMKRMLEKLSCESESAADGQAALAAYAAAMKAGRPFDAVILDLTFPGGLGGLETGADPAWWLIKRNRSQR